MAFPNGILRLLNIEKAARPSDWTRILVAKLATRRLRISLLTEFANDTHPIFVADHGRGDDDRPHCQRPARDAVHGDAGRRAGDCGDVRWADADRRNGV